MDICSLCECTYILHMQGLFFYRRIHGKILAFKDVSLKEILAFKDVG